MLKNRIYNSKINKNNAWQIHRVMI
jgi:hypothetical protein